MSATQEVGVAFLESVYEECLEIEFALQSIPFKPQLDLPLSYKRRRLNRVFRPEFICFDTVIVEIKAVSPLTDMHRAQALNYLKANGLRLGLLVNFRGHPQLEWERFVLKSAAVFSFLFSCSFMPFVANIPVPCCGQ
ncbi:MAG TPA: GxxExxY protein [Lacipirellulaceae bacterium]|nr:GxxExxY protein [Lacipirellulaceae bacterium]